MASLARFIRAQTETSALRSVRHNQLVSGVVVRLDGSQILVNIGDRTVGAQPILAQPFLAGDRVWVQFGLGQPKIIGWQGRDTGAT